MLESQQSQIMALKIGSLKINILEAIENIQNFLNIKTYTKCKRRFQTYVIPDKAIFGNSLKNIMKDNE